MNATRHYIRTLLLMLLLVTGGSRETWADVTYHIICQTFYNKDLDKHLGKAEGVHEEIRLDILKCTSAETTVGLPDIFKSPLATNFKYYTLSGATISDLSSVQANYPNTIYYKNFQSVDFDPPYGTDVTELPPGSTIPGGTTDIYVTYETNTTLYNTDGYPDLSGNTEYNITVSNKIFYFNENRNDRPGAISTAEATDLVSDELNSSRQYFLWKTVGADPYNIVLTSCYNGAKTERHNSTIYARWENGKTYSMWLKDKGSYMNADMVNADLYTSFTLLTRNGKLALMPVNLNKYFPNNSGQYPYLSENGGRDPMPKVYDNSSAQIEEVKFYEVFNYTFKVKTPFYTDSDDPADKHVVSATRKWSSHPIASQLNLTKNVPDDLKRKYVVFDGAYKETTFATAMTTFEDANANAVVIDDKKQVWLKYSLSASMPFELNTSFTFSDLKWYNIYVNKEERYITWYDTTDGNKFNTNSNHSKYTHDSHFAFIGDPYELYVVSRQASEDNSNTPHYLALAATETDALTTNTSIATDDIWEIVYDDNTGDYANCFRLRQYKSAASPVYVGWAFGTGNYPLNGNTTTAARLSVLELPLLTYTYHIVDNSGRIAVKATAEQIIGTTLDYNAIPEIIRSPFIEGATLSFTTYDSDAMTTHTTPITQTNNDLDATYKNHIFVTYTALDAYTSRIDGDEYNVRLNGQYIYYEDNTIKSKDDITGHASDNNYLWALGGADPYAMTILNKGNNQYVNVASWTNDAALGWHASDASRFIIKSGSQANTYEVMATTGDDVDASSTYYNIGRPEGNEVKIYSNATYTHGNSEIRFQLIPSTAHDVTYHLIDKEEKDLLQVKARQAVGDAPQIPAEIFSPLVQTYYYYLLTDFTHDAVKNTYTLNGSPSQVTAIGAAGTATDHIYITYTANDLVDLNHTTMYLLKFAQGDDFRQENGSDGLLNAVTPAQIAAMTDEQKAAYYKEYQAVYPYCNGDCNFNVYGQYQYELQQEGAASTRTRWAWYVESGNNDPYHVKILSRQSETYNGLERRAYFSTRKFEGYDQVVTSLVWPNISGVLATDYMVLGSVGQYQLVTSEAIDGQRYVVDSFEQYWKTYDTVKKKLLVDLLPLCEERERTDRTDGSIEVPTAPASLRERLTNDYNFHSYSKMAYAKRWNGYNAAGEKKKGWESREHWFQTVKMGSGYFDFIPTTIDPALILLDQHGWEIMRKPLPTGPDDPDKDKKYEALRAYDSPMVKEYIFWASAKKRSGLHQYYLMDKRIGGSDFTSTSLTSLPPYDSENVRDNKGNQYDEYVTYIVKEEYAVSYNPATKTAEPFLIRQGDCLAKKGAAGNKVSVATEGVSQYIIDHIGTLSDELWYVKPNTDIDTEMGYTASNHNWGTTNPNAYDSDSPYYTNQVADIVTGSANITKYGQFTFSNGFDPYNIQLSSYTGDQYFTTGMTGAEVLEGIMQGKYGSTDVTLADKATTMVDGNGYDNSVWKMTNQTFMAVQDEDGNMQLMPRFDHTLRMRDFRALVTTTEEAGDPNKLKETYTQLYRPFVYNYIIVDNDGHESLRYQSGGDLVPQIPDHFKSPLAKDFKYYKGLTLAGEVYTEVANGADISGKEITASLAGAGLTTPLVTTSNHVYVRYAYDEDADEQYMLKGKWLSIKLNDLDAQYADGLIKSGSKPATSPTDDLANSKAWHWKFLKNPSTAPDPYAVKVFNRTEKDKPMSVQTANISQDGGTIVTAQTDNAENYSQRFALLRHGTTAYALAVAGTGDHANYYFMNGANLASQAKTVKESGFSVYSGTLTDAAKLTLTDDITNTYTYKVYTNAVGGEHDGRYGTFAIEAPQTNSEALDNDFVPVLPDAAWSPLLTLDEFAYYESEADMGVSGKKLAHLYGLYDGNVYVRYTYDPTKSEYKVPNERTTDASLVARSNASNDSPLRLDGLLPYNIFWLNNNIMKNDGDAVKGEAGKTDLDAAAEYEWLLEGDDPYAIKIKNKKNEKYIDASAGLSDSPQTFMLLPGHDYGVLAFTGTTTNQRLTMADDGTDVLSVITTGDTQPFIIFALGTLKVVYHLVIAEIGGTEEIPWRDTGTSTTNVWNETDKGYDTYWDAADTKEIHGTTARDLTSRIVPGSGQDGDKYQLGEIINGKTYCIDMGRISLGDSLTVPSEFFRPNVVYSFFVDDINDAAVSNHYKGMEIKSKRMGLDLDLIGKTININIVYSFNGSLDTNAGDNFVVSVDQNKWYTLEMVKDGKTYLAQYTNAWGFEMKEGRESHYTNDYLWTPIGDPYGFRLFNRYMDVNSGNDNMGEKDRAIFSRHFSNAETGDIHTDGQQVLIGNYKTDERVVIPGEAAIASQDHTVVATNSIYELLESTTPGYFRIHPMANNSGIRYYFDPVWANDDGDDTPNYLVRLKETAAEFTFGLSKELMKPYFDRAGYVGGLKKSVYDTPANAAVVAAMKSNSETISASLLMQAQTLVYNFDNVVPFETGYFRMHSTPDVSVVSPSRYASGYTHKTELTGGESSKPIPMHFYEKNSDEVRQFTDLREGFTTSHATRGDIVIPPVVDDPASIFYFEKINAADRNNLAYISTEGLYITGEKGQVTVTYEGGAPTWASSDPNIEGESERPAAIMTEDKNKATKLFVMDIGGGILLIHDNVTDAGRRFLKYLSFHQNDGVNIYDLKMTNHTHTDHAKWCMQPVQDTETKGVNEMELRLKLNKGGDGYYYATFYAPYDVLLTNAATDAAYVCKVWDTEILHLKKVGRYNTTANGCPAAFVGNDRFVPAGTPVIIRSTNTTVTMALPTKSPSTTLSENYVSTVGNIFKGKYLEQLLEMGSDDVYTFGLPISGRSIDKDPSYDSNGKITIVLPQMAETGVGFYINVNPNREEGAAMGEWIRNNKYVYSNKIYIRPPVAGARPATRNATFIPVSFDDGGDEPTETNGQQNSDGRVYDLQGRCVATPDMVKDGTWRQHLAPGIYILNGRKISLKRP